MQYIAVYEKKKYVAVCDTTQVYRCNCLLCGIFYCCKESILLASNVSNGIYVN